MTIKYRTMQLEDYGQAYKLWEQSEGIGLSSADSPEAIAAYLERNPGISQAAFEGKNLVGTVLCGHDGRRGYLHHLAVAKNFQRKGIGKQLVHRCLAALRTEGIQKCHLFVFEDNKTARTFWVETGWHERDDLMLVSRLTGIEHG